MWKPSRREVLSGLTSGAVSFGAGSIIWAKNVDPNAQPPKSE